MIELSSTPTDSQHKLWESLGYAEANMPILARYYDLERARCCIEAAQRILEYVHAKGYTKALLTFDSWHDGYPLARDKNGYRYVITGSYWPGGYVLRGIVRERRKNKPFSWLCNGQANKNAIQIAHVGENDRVPFPEFDEAQQAFTDLLNRPKATVV